MDKFRIPDSVWENILSKYTFQECRTTSYTKELWYGFFDGDEVVLGASCSDIDKGTWYYNSESLRINFFAEFYDSRKLVVSSLKSFLNRKYGLNLKSLL